MVKFVKKYKLLARAGKKKYLIGEYKILKRQKMPVKIRNLKKPIGKHKYGLYARVVDLRTRKKRR
jgi:hypothetical protein